MKLREYRRTVNKINEILGTIKLTRYGTQEVNYKTNKNRKLVSCNNMLKLKK